MAAVDTQELIQRLANRITKEILEGATKSIAGDDQSIAYEAGRRYGFARGMEFAREFLIKEFARKEETDSDL